MILGNINVSLYEKSITCLKSELFSAKKSRIILTLCCIAWFIGENFDFK